MPALRDASFIVGNPIAHDLGGTLWPPDQVQVGGRLSIRRVVERFAGPGAALRTLAQGKIQSWRNIDRTQVTSGLRARVLDPCLVRQLDAQLCGPAAVAFELARRDPCRYVETVASILTTGGFTGPSGRRIHAEAELRAGALPSANKNGERLDHADWLLMATLRDDENAIFDVDGDDAKRGAAGLTLPGEMACWTKDVLGLHPDSISCVNSGEIAAIRRADVAVRAGGSAFLLIDSSLISDGQGDTEESIGFERISHLGGGRVVRQGSRHSRDDDFLNHWVVYLGGLALDPRAGDDSSAPISLRLWSWGSEFIVSGTAEAFSEYLWGVVVGTH